MTLFWHRRDLRFPDNAGLYHALKRNEEVVPVFIFDRNILDKLPSRSDARVTFIQRSVARLAEWYRDYGSTLLTFYGDPVEIWKQLRDEYRPNAVYTNRDYEPYALERDQAVADLLAERKIPFRTYKDHVIFESEEVEKQAGGSYTVFTPYMRSWLRRLDSRLIRRGEADVSFYLAPYPTERYAGSLHQSPTQHPVPTLEEMGFSPTETYLPPPDPPRELLEAYGRNRDFPAVEGTTRWGIHLRHGTVSVRQKAREARATNDTLLKELIWRDFYSNVLQAHPRVAYGSFRPEYDAIPWRNDEEEFAAWCAGRTGVPIVDAGMRQLNETGFMHNRVRMIVASYLTKHLLIDWRWGEAYFADKLLDYELASNNGGWQWAAGSGVDAQPYFRIFNYESQQRKFDPEYRYVKRWVSEFGTPDYPDEPLVEHKFGRERALRVYKQALQAVRNH
ncbi:deoxyribodipyrimidine photo-lyase [Lewinella marina]|uniref:Deoxyribodipyrimidine photolyase n=1 Tax=Neolewinella marina TaxID=438751 RepID=A0A2G0CDR6_9BACT|nr:deoxyribodipyrimidine photo-lyase [Neolewinella marina]NJB85911.1 deoxyribodipyrimidine photo-lyase [Neolewinella marina]PHK98112.1 deoxyribodipyrimidine photolyase [Neolewinella marina]